MRALLLIAVSLPAIADTGNAVCARCHAAIAKKYAATGMAQTSGRTGQPGFKEEFGHPNVTPAYQLQIEGVTRQLEYFLGSGHIGRSYLFRKAGQLFQAPLSYYSAPRKWDTSPGYESKSYPELTRAVEPACLQCHASPSRPFVDSGVTCERCHGPGEKHAAFPNRRNIVNPARLPGEQRESVCAQCHLTGAARIARAGRARGTFTPGEKLSDSIAVFVWDTPEGVEPTATSHFEKLSRSRCRQASGEKLWCGTCHESHTDSTPVYYNRQCQSCHAQKRCTGSEKENCIDCHMTKRAASRSVEHLAFTDHAIPRRPTKPAAQTADSLREFWTGQANPRDTALAFAAANLDAAFPLLEDAAKANLKDIPLLLQLAQYYERMADEDRAEKLYAQILAADPANATAAVNLGTYQIRRGNATEAMALWLKALARNPALINARLNLAVAQYQSGNPPAARASLLAVLDYEPAHPAALRILAQLP